MITVAAFSCVASVFCCELVHKKIKDLKDDQVIVVNQLQNGNKIQNLIPKDLLKFSGKGNDGFYAGSESPMHKKKNSAAEVMWY